MRTDLVLLFAVGVSSMELKMYEVEVNQIYETDHEFQPVEANQIYETDHEFQPMLIAMMDHMKDLLDDMKNIQIEMSRRTCQENEKKSMHKRHIDKEGISTRTFCTHLSGNYRSCKNICDNLRFSSRFKCKATIWWRYVNACLGGRDEMTCLNAPTSTSISTSSDSTDCDYSTFGSSHTMNLPKKESCGPNNYSGISSSEINTILNKHNTLRAKVANGRETQGCPGPQPSATNMLEMRWNSQLAEVAQAWAEQCPNLKGPNPHDASDNRKICASDYHVGQNIYSYWGQDSTSAWENAIDSWYNEVKDMPNSLVSRFGSNTCSSRGIIGHYTQVVWAATNEVGCGGIHYPGTLGGTTYPESKIYVCNYGPGGNFLGSPLYESGTTASNCPSGTGASSDYPGLCV